MKKTKPKQWTDLERALRGVITSDPKSSLLISGDMSTPRNGRLVMGTVVPPCPFCGCRALIVSIIDEVIDALAVLECAQCRASSTVIELLGAWQWSAWDRMLPRSKR